MTVRVSAKRSRFAEFANIVLFGLTRPQRKKRKNRRRAGGPKNPSSSPGQARRVSGADAGRAAAFSGSAPHQAAAVLSRMAVVVVAAYIAAQMVADIASLKIGVVAGLAVDMGTFIYPITFTLRDLVHKSLGKRNAQLLIIAAAVINLAMVLYLMWSASVPSDPASFGGVEFSAIFAPLWRIVSASILAELVSELIDTEIYHLFVSRITTRFQWLRVLVSNSVSVPVDNLIFVLIAFSPFVFLGAQLVDSWAVTWEIFVFNLLVKYGVTLVSMPLIYLTPDRDWRQDQ